MTPQELRAQLHNESRNWARLGAVGPRLMIETVLHAGVDCIAQSLPARFNRRPPRWCFANAAALVRRARGLTYVEGYAKRADVPMHMHHAWAIDTDRRVIDPTWDDPEIAAYVGVPIDRVIYETVTRRGNSASVFDSDRGLRTEFLLTLHPALADLLRCR